MATPGTARKQHEKLGSSVRMALNEQVARLQVKHLAEMELLDDIRSFMKQRSQLEKEYAQNMQKLAQQYLNKREIKSPPEVKTLDRSENRGVMEIWKQLLQKTEELGKRHSDIGDLFMSSISETMKTLRRQKEQLYKQHIDVAHRMVNEVLESVRELTLGKKSYSEKWRMHEDARIKYQDASERLKTSQFKLFESKSTLEKTSKKCGEKFNMAQKQGVVARNNYVLLLAQTNAHLTKHFEADLPAIMKALDGALYEKVKHAYILYSQIQVDCNNAIRADFEDLREQAALVSREYVVECFLKEHSILKDKIVYKFEPAGNDKITTISKDHGAALHLDKEARKWAQEWTKLQQEILSKNKSIKGLQSVTHVYQTTPEFGTTDATAEAEEKLFQIQEEIRQIEVITTKANSRMDVLREAGIDINKWLQQAALTAGDYTGERRSSDKPDSQPDLLSLSTSVTGGEDSVSIKSDANTDTMSVGSYQSETTSPAYGLALYSYQAQRDDELDIHTDDELEIVEWDDGDGWCRGKKDGREGYLPQSYIKVISRPSSPQTSISTTTGLSINTSVSLGVAEGGAGKEKVFVKALYGYSAQDSEELSFPEDAIIELFRTDTNGIDDGYWEGQYNGKTGVFPSVVVEILSGKANQHMTPDLTPVNSEVRQFPFLSTSPPSDFSPPDYPAPALSAQDYGSLGSDLRSLGSSSSLGNSSTPLQQKKGTTSPSSTPSAVRQIVFSKTKDRNTTLLETSLNSSFQDSFEDTLQDTANIDNNDRWSSFEDLPDDDCYV